MNKKVLLISHMPPPTTGIGSWTRRVLENGIPEGWEIGFINSNMIGGRDPFRNTKINIKDEIKRSYSVWKQEADELKKDKNYRVVHTNIPCTVFGMIRESVVALIAKRYKKKFVLHCHCTIPNVVNKWHKRLIFSLFIRLVDGVILLNTQSKQIVCKYTKKPIKIIPNFVNEDEVELGDKRVPEGAVENVVFVGGVSPDKGCDTIVFAAEKMPNITFNLVGIVSEEIQSMEIPKNVILHGNQSRESVREFLNNADAFLFLSRYFGEGFSVALVEAMSAGLPCVVTDWAANADMVGKEGGIVIPQQSPDALVEALHKLNDPYLRTLMSKRNAETAKMAYTSHVVLQQIAELYDTL